MNLNLTVNCGLFLTRTKDRWVQEMPIRTRYGVMCVLPFVFCTVWKLHFFLLFNLLAPNGFWYLVHISSQEDIMTSKVIVPFNGDIFVWKKKKNNWQICYYEIEHYDFSSLFLSLSSKQPSKCWSSVDSVAVFQRHLQRKD